MTRGSPGPGASALLIGALLAGCGVRAPARIDVEALVRAKGTVVARGDLEVHLLDTPRDVQGHLALAELADRTGRSTQAIDELEAVLRLGGPIGTRWHPRDRARLARLLAARGRVRLARNSAAAREDLVRARSFGAAISTEELDRARAAIAVVRLRHVDAKERAAGQAELAALAGAPFADPSWLGAKPAPVPLDRGRFGVWLWEHGARRAAWEALRGWFETTAARTGPELATYERARAWWTPVDDAARAVEPATMPPSAPAPSVGLAPGVAGDPLAEALAAHLASRGLARLPVVRLLRAYRRDPAIADRLARDLVAAAVDAAIVHAALGALFDALGDPARARIAWQAASTLDPSPEFIASLAEAMARGSDPDAAMVHGTVAAAASGDPARVWVSLAQVLVDSGREVHALEAARSAIDLAGPETIGSALEVAIAASRGLGRLDQARVLSARRQRWLGAPAAESVQGGEGPSVPPALAVALAQHWVTTRAHPRDADGRAALLALLERDDPRRATVIAELVALAGDPSPEVARRALAALR